MPAGLWLSAGGSAPTSSVGGSLRACHPILKYRDFNDMGASQKKKILILSIGESIGKMLFRVIDPGFEKASTPGFSGF